jgi:hypothetical protein
MQLLNLTGMAAGYTLGLDVDGGERLVVVVKGTFTLPRDGGAARLAEEQMELADADQFIGPPGASAATVECDYAPVKPFCDVLLNGSAWAARPAPRVVVGLQVGAMKKAMAVHGDRRWQADAIGIAAGEAAPFTQMPVNYSRAFGGVDERSSDPKRRGTYLDNPVGCGWHSSTDHWLVNGAPVANTEQIGDPVRHSAGKYRPMAYGPVGRNVPGRLRYAGTYDQHWQNDIFPFLPSDFDPRYFQSAAPDQQMAEPRGGERVLMVNLTPDGRREFVLPQNEMPVAFMRRRGGREDVRAMLDTVLFEPDAGRFTMCWRASLRLQRDIFEIVQIIAGKMSRGRQRAMETGKSFETLAERVKARQPEEVA